jgi:hypothetical protein
MMNQITIRGEDQMSARVFLNGERVAGCTRIEFVADAGSDDVFKVTLTLMASVDIEVRAEVTVNEAEPA